MWVKVTRHRFRAPPPHRSPRPRTIASPGRVCSLVRAHTPSGPTTTHTHTYCNPLCPLLLLHLYVNFYAISPHPPHTPITSAIGFFAHNIIIVRGKKIWINNNNYVKFTVQRINIIKYLCARTAIIIIIDIYVRVRRIIHSFRGNCLEIFAQLLLPAACVYNIIYGRDRYTHTHIYI